ncbi:hypothetical protein N7495_007821 [Penicillium taxi]|uniref:uncharacterized protein n=1 Tax=Penicillium taxi TaxID=168475 RepID=UPI0025458A4C|nr:uncharacterized protein N7495_007821 [Penicillium taxi]KAJ5887780.1 hypothetical protein N7495_007821 [Penicillium taxi]
MTSQTPTVRIVEVGPRDGLQNHKSPVSTTTKLELIQRLEDSGLRTIEMTSVVSPKAVPQLADCRDILGDTGIQHRLRTSPLRFPVLVPNLKGLEIAMQYGVKEISVFISATDGFSQANINCSVLESIERVNRVVALATKACIAVRGYVSCIFSDPYHGETSPAAVLRSTRALLGAGCYEVSLGDTLGIGSPADVRRLLKYLISHGISPDRLAGHFHDTYGQAVANVWEAYQCGIRVFDSSVSGLGGCPFAPGAKGNVASEDVVYMFHNAGIETGVDLAKLAVTGDWISRLLGTVNHSRVGPAILGKEMAFLGEHHGDLTISWDFIEAKRLRLYRSGVNLKILR